MDGALVVIKGANETKIHNNFAFFASFDETISIGVFIPKLNPEQNIENFEIVFREYDPEKKKISSSTHKKLPYPFKRSFFSPNEDVTDFQFQDNFWFTRDNIPNLKFYYSKVTYSLSKLALKEKKFYDVSIKSNNNYYHKYYIVVGRIEEYPWTNFVRFNYAMLALAFFNTCFYSEVGEEEAQRLTMILLAKMIKEKNNTHTHVAQLVDDGSKQDFKNIADSYLEESPPDLLNWLAYDQRYMKQYILNKVDLDDSKSDLIRDRLGLCNRLPAIFSSEIFDRIKPSPTVLANTVNEIGMAASCYGDSNTIQKDVDNVVVLYTILKPLLDDIEKQ